MSQFVETATERVKTMENRLHQIKLIIQEQENAGYRTNKLNTIDMKWLIEQAEKAITATKE